MAQLTVSCFSKIQIGFTFLVPAHPGSPGLRAVQWYVCVCVWRGSVFKPVCLCTACSTTAKFDSFQCYSKDQCIPVAYYCNGDKNCHDGSDEDEEICGSQWQFALFHPQAYPTLGIKGFISSQNSPLFSGSKFKTPSRWGWNFQKPHGCKICDSLCTS